MKRFWRSLTGWLDRLRMDMNLLDLERKHRQMGSQNPALDARHEVFQRSYYLERFRDEASMYFLAGVPLEKFREDFIKKNLMAKVSHLSTAETAQLRAIVREMPHDEALYGAALTKWRQEMASWLAEAEQINRRAHGPMGIDERTRRVLRSGR